MGFYVRDVIFSMIFIGVLTLNVTTARPNEDLKTTDNLEINNTITTTKTPEISIFEPSEQDRYDGFEDLSYMLVHDQPPYRRKREMVVTKSETSEEKAGKRRLVDGSESHRRVERVSDNDDFESTTSSINKFVINFKDLDIQVNPKAKELECVCMMKMSPQFVTHVYLNSSHINCSKPCARSGRKHFKAHVQVACNHKTDQDSTETMDRVICQVDPHGPQPLYTMTDWVDYVPMLMLLLLFVLALLHLVLLKKNFYVAVRRV